jgi:hypothetical protein
MKGPLLLVACIMECDSTVVRTLYQRHAVAR